MIFVLYITFNYSIILLNCFKDIDLSIMDIDTKHQKLFKLVGFKWKQLVETDRCYKYLATKMDKAKSTMFYLEIHSIQFVFDKFILYTIHFVIMALNFSIFI